MDVITYSLGHGSHRLGSYRNIIRLYLPERVLVANIALTSKQSGGLIGPEELSVFQATLVKFKNNYVDVQKIHLVCH